MDRRKWFIHKIGKTIYKNGVEPVVVHDEQRALYLWETEGLSTKSGISLKYFGFDVEDRFNYEHGKPDLKERTKKRLIRISDCGMTISGSGEFGYDGVMSGLYIEKVWSYPAKDFNSYMKWVIGLIKRKDKKP